MQWTFYFYFASDVASVATNCRIESSEISAIYLLSTCIIALTLEISRARVLAAHRVFLIAHALYFKESRDIREGRAEAVN